MQASPVPIPAPFMGMNSREGMAALQPAEARFLENWNPEGNGVKPRLGYQTSSSGGQSLAAVETLTAYNGASGQALIGVNGGAIWDFSSATAIQLYDGMYTSSRFQTENYSNYLIGVNGTDIPWSFNGTAVAATGFTGSGLTLTDLINIRKVRNRLWFCENDSADAWYGGLGSITGSLTEFQLSQVVSGGYLMAIGAHSQDAGDGPDDYTAFVMSTGEVVLYSGDPSTTFTKVGNYFMPPPLGRQCLVNIGGPLAVLTHAGLIPLQAAVTGVAFDVFAIGNFGKIGPSIKRDIDDYGDNDGWQAVLHENNVVINVPVDDGDIRQWAYNYLKGTWTRWRGYNASCFTVWHDLFYGDASDGIVRKVTGANDAGTPIEMKARCAFVNLGGGRGMTASGVRFDVSIEGEMTGRFGLDVDYIERTIDDNAELTIAASDASTPWGSPWGSAWSESTQYGSQWLGAYGQGRTVGLVIEAETNATNCDWYSSHVLAQPTQGVLP